MGAKSRRKGAGWEREVAIDLRAVYPDAKRGLGQPRSARECPDVDGTPWWIECKRGARVSVRAAMAQAQQATDGRIPLVVVREDRSEAIACLPWAAMVRLLDAAKGVEAKRDAELAEGAMARQEGGVQ